MQGGPGTWHMAQHLPDFSPSVSYDASKHSHVANKAISHTHLRNQRSLQKFKPGWQNFYQPHPVTKAHHPIMPLPYSENSQVCRKEIKNSLENYPMIL